MAELRVDPSLAERIHAVVDALAGRGVLSTNEADLTEAVSRCLDEARLSYVREVSLDDSSRLDFLVGDVALELKVKGGLPALIRQIDRYASFEQVRAIVVITTSRRLSWLPSCLRGKPVTSIYMGAGL